MTTYAIASGAPLATPSTPRDAGLTDRSVARDALRLAVFAALTAAAAWRYAGVEDYAVSVHTPTSKR